MVILGGISWDIHQSEISVKNYSVFIGTIVCLKKRLHFCSRYFHKLSHSILVDDGKLCQV